jgi:hypothetical protein
MEFSTLRCWLTDPLEIEPLVTSDLYSGGSLDLGLLGVTPQGLDMLAYTRHITSQERRRVALRPVTVSQEIDLSAPAVNTSVASRPWDTAPGCQKLTQRHVYRSLDLSRALKRIVS